MATYKDIANFESFSVFTITGRQGALYANGLQQARVYVRFTPLDKNFNYLEITDLDSLIPNIELINYITEEALPYQREASNLQGSDWCYTRTAGDYLELTGTRLNEKDDIINATSNAEPDDASYSRNVLASGKSVTVGFYIVCPPDVKLRQITLGAAFRLANGDKITTTGTSGFDSSVLLTAYDPITYRIDHGLHVNKEVYLEDQPNEYLYNYHVTLLSSYNPTAKMRDMLCYPVGSEPSEDNLWPGFDKLFPDKAGFWPEVISKQYAFSLNIIKNYLSVCYAYSHPVPVFNTLGVMDAARDNKPNGVAGGFNFSVFYTSHWPSDKFILDNKFAARLRCDFRDQYGNPGSFEVFPASGDYRITDLRDLQFGNLI